MKTLTLIEKDCKNFLKQTLKVNGKIFHINRIMNNGSGVDIEIKMFPCCGLKCKGRAKVNNAENFIFYCPVCSQNQKYE